MTRTTETINRINNALAVTVDQLTGDALRDARDLIADLTCQRANCTVCGTGVYAQNGVRDAGPAPFGGRNRGTRRDE